jgi:type IV pilus assembly protein PilC
VKTFYYEGIDAAGRTESGRLTAGDANEAVTRLSSAGFRLRALQELASAPSSAPLAPPPPSGARARSGRVVPSSTSFAPIGQLAPAAQPVDYSPPPLEPADYVLAGPPRSQPYFMALQLEPLLKAGHGPSRLLEMLADRPYQMTSPLDLIGMMRWPMTRRALRLTAKETSAGDDLGGSMARRPRTFPVELTGPLRAGAVGGYLPEAARRAAQPIAQARRIGGIAQFFLGGSAVATAFAFWFALIGSQGVRRILLAVNAGDSDTFGAFLGGIGEGFDRSGPLFIGGSVLIALGIVFMRSLAAKPMRHAWCAQMPPTRRRTRTENLREFAWHLGQLSKAGIAPSSAWSAAAQAVPNIWWQRRLTEVGAQARDGAKITDLANHAGLFPQDVAGLIATGEMTGTVDQALEHVAELQDEENRSAGRALGIKVAVWTMLLVFGGGVLAFSLFYASYLHGAMNIITAD